jgi:hypothetical protein
MLNVQFCAESVAQAIRVGKERQKKHADAITAVVRARKTALLKTANNWGQSNTLLEFIAACEAQWKNQACEPTAEQTACGNMGPRDRHCNVAFLDELPGSGE